MKTEVTVAVKRLDAILPLQSGLRSLDSNDAGLYCKILNSYVQKGRTLTRAEASALADDADSALTNIARQKLIVLDAGGNPAGAYPFTSEQREHRISVNGVTVHCMCALDALAVSPMFSLPVEINSQCRVTGRKVQLLQDGYNFTAGTLDVWFGIDWDAATSVACCADSLCTEMIFLADESVARQWQSERESTRELFDLESALAFAAGFFVPLIEQCRKSS
jgi:mercuric reductase